MRVRKGKGQKVTALFRIRGQDQDAVGICQNWFHRADVRTSGEENQAAWDE